ncbi:MAG: ABC transporter substrate-binding protein [bacterium]|nr:ABC transporter substrate-binding protein [bacterium]
MRRRRFLTLLSGAAAWPLAARAQQPATLPVIGFLGANSHQAQRESTAAMLQRLRELGWIEGRNFRIEYRWAEGRYDRSFELVAELLGLKADVIVTHATPNVLAARRATSTIPVVFAAVGDPVGNGLVASLARPGGNVTGLSLQSSDLAGKRLELLREIIPGRRRLSVLSNPASPNAPLEVGELRAANLKFDFEISVLEIKRSEDIAPAIEGLKGSIDALYVQTDPLFYTNRSLIGALALDAKLPTISGTREYVEAGSLISYGANFTDLFRRTADYIDKILRGANAADLPVQQPTKFDLIVNLKTAKALGIEPSPTFLARTDETVE